MLQETDKQIDALLVCSADHTHAIASITAMKMGKHVYCEKPLGNTIQQARALIAAERKYNKVSTQLGLQGHAGEDGRMLVEWIRDGAIGTVTQIDIFDNSRERAAAEYYGRLQHIHDEIPIPATVKWDLWLGPAAYRTFSPLYLPGRWRDWVDFGTGALGDHLPHYLDPVYWALDLGLPESIEAETDPEYGVQEESQFHPNRSTVRYRFPARGKRPGVNMTWRGHWTQEIPKGWNPEKSFPQTGGIITGTQGTIVYGAIFNGKPGQNVPDMVTLLPAELDKEYKRPVKTLPRPASHWLEWVERSKAGKPGDANFAYGGRVTEMALLGNIAIHHKGQKLEFDAKTERFTNSDSANRMFDRPAREGWALPA
jgi:predicted dehydrogenase